MNVLQRVITLVKANINDLIDKAEDPEKMIKQLILDLNNQLIQVKTTVAQSLADQFMLENKLKQVEKDGLAAERQAGVAVEKGDDFMARIALQRMNSFRDSAMEISCQLEVQRSETESMKVILSQIENKIAEVNREKDVLLARHRRAVAREKLTKSRSNIDPSKMEELLDNIGRYVDKAEATAKAYVVLDSENNNRSLAKFEEDAKLDDQLAELKAKHHKALAPSNSES